MADPDELAVDHSITENDRLTPVDHVLASRVGSDLVLLDVNSGRYFGLDAVGTTIFELVREGLPQGAVLAKLVQTYDCDPHTLQADLREFSQTLLSLGLLRRLA